MRIFKIFGTTLADKARILVFNIASGLLSLAIVSFIYHSSLKDDYDTLFMEYSQSLVKLEDVRRIINNSQSLFHGSLGSAEIAIVKQDIISKWDAYQDFQNRLLETKDSTHFLLNFFHFLFPDDSVLHKKEELKYKLNDLNEEIHVYIILIDQSNKYLSEEIKQSINRLNHKISSIVHENLQFTEIKKNRNSALHAILQKVILVITCLIMLITMLLSYLILRNIKNLHTTLEIKVKEKTRELQTLNNSLQETIAKEVLESRKKDQIMYQQARLASMGEMIGNIAHQWRQPLNALILLIQTFKVKSQNGKLTQEFITKQVEDGLKIAKRMSQTIEDFRNFFNSANDKECFNLRENIEDSISLVDSFLRQNEISISVDCSNDIVLCGYKSAFSQVILNLIKNSEDVLKEREISPAKIRISVEVVQENSGFKERDAKEYVKILFMDNGGGVKLDDIQKIFEPYFTTKHKSVGTGIGLYMSKQIIEKQMQGSIEVRNVRCDDALNIMCKEGECKLQDGACGAQFIITIPLGINKERESD